MSRVLVLYGTSEGHTALIAEAIADRLRLLHTAADVVDASKANPAPESYDGVIVAASLHIGKYQKAVTAWVRQHAAGLAMRENAFISMSLGVLQRDAKVDGDLKRIVERFARDTGWQPQTVRMWPGALLYTKYGVVTRWFMKRIAAKAGGDTDTSRDYDYTDWTEVAALADEFVRRLAPAA